MTIVYHELINNAQFSTITPSKTTAGSLDHCRKSYAIHGRQRGAVAARRTCNLKVTGSRPSEGFVAVPLGKAPNGNPRSLSGRQMVNVRCLYVMFVACSVSVMG